MHLVFYRTSDVFEAEEMLHQISIPVEIVPTPVQDKAYCGVCAYISENDIIKAEECLIDLDYKLIP
ncbi:MAG: putative Se/S carrier-like protein [Candidatus Fimisoma sp.]|nr:putative Se/S carrier-like protein [Candidatus Fimisoma sp.]